MFLAIMAWRGYNPSISTMESLMEENKPPGTVLPEDGALPPIAVESSPLPPTTESAASDEPTRKPPSPRTHRRRRSNLFETWLVNIAFLAIGLVIGFVGRPMIVNTPADAGATGQASMANLLLSQTRHFRGNANAPVTIIEFSDFQ